MDLGQVRMGDRCDQEGHGATHLSQLERGGAGKDQGADAQRRERHDESDDLGDHLVHIGTRGGLMVSWGGKLRKLLLAWELAHHPPPNTIHKCKNSGIWNNCIGLP